MKNNQTHMPGPWTAQNIFKDGSEVEIVAKNNYAVAQVPGDNRLIPVKINLANAHLIAAAPDIKHELEILIGYAEVKHLPTAREIEMARAAIAKAEVR